MIRNVERAWYEVWGTEEAQNRFLKAILVFFISLCLTQSVALIVLALRKPPVIAVSSTESRVLTVVPPREELVESEIRRAISGYVSAHYNWEWNKIDEAFNTASKYVDPGFVKGFVSANQEQAKTAKEKKISQRFYVSELKVDAKSKRVRVSGDRIILVESLRATNPLLLDVQFDFGSRSVSNPEGIYVVGEKLVSNTQADEGAQGGAR
jgi:hypothetical protein